MPDTPPRPVTPRVDDASADLGTLVDLGVVEEQPEPQAPEPPATPEPEPEPVEPTTPSVPEPSEPDPGTDPPASTS